MNLGDGLLFELENGKPKLILLNRGEKVQKNPVKQRPRLPSVLSCRQPSRLDTPRTEEQPIKKQIALNGRSHQNKPGRGGATVREQGQTQENPAAVKEVKNNAKVLLSNVKSAKPQNVRPNRKTEEPNKKAQQIVKLSNQSAVLSDTLSCVTNEQLQHILSTVQTSSESPRAEELKMDCSPESKVSEPNESGDMGVETKTDNTPDTEKQCGGLFSWVEQRPSEDRAVLEAKKTQWKKELDEQVALKQKIQRSAPPRVQGDEDTENLATVRSSVSYKDLPAAIRSSLRVGEGVPVDEMELKQEQKLEQRRQWLQELDKQREETSERKRLEKLQQQQTEDQQLWASHFDSLHRPPLTTPLFPSAERAEVGLCSSTDWGEAGVSSSLSQWEEGSIRASVDTHTSGGHTSRTSHLRTMTSLLDPAELEERERRRLKQLEQQRAIGLQVEERRRRREEEEVQKKREEEEEEQRVQQERERLQRQYERDTLQERHKEQRSPEAEPSVQDAIQPPPQSSTGTYPEENPEPKAGTTAINHHRDTAVQTEEVHISESLNPESVGEVPAAVTDRAQILQMLQMLQKGCGADVYEPFARTERNKKDLKRPEWNTQRPSRRFVPASQRYPEELQRQRQESRLRRQAQLLSLQRNPTNNQHIQPTAILTTQHVLNGEETPRGSSKVETVGETAERGRSPVHCESPAPDFLPYVRTDDVFNLNAHETRPAPLPGPQLLQKTQRQQEIIRGLAQLREGLLQKQRELESDLSRSRLDNNLRPLSTTLTYHREL